MKSVTPVPDSRRRKADETARKMRCLALTLAALGCTRWVHAPAHISPTQINPRTHVYPARRSAAPPAVTWQDDIGAAGTICSAGTGLCHSYSHVVFIAQPASGDATDALFGGASYSLDGGTRYINPFL